MTWQLIFTDQYNRKAAKFIKQHPNALTQYIKALELLTVNPHHPSLRLHSLKRKLSGRSGDGADPWGRAGVVYAR
jgi:mRNA-degrading endonuclease YafQ of YafQ-DinJ toxin-antitoxin module